MAGVERQQFGQPLPETNELIGHVVDSDAYLDLVLVFSSLGALSDPLYKDKSKLV